MSAPPSVAPFAGLLADLAIDLRRGACCLVVCDKGWTLPVFRTRGEDGLIAGLLLLAEPGGVEVRVCQPGGRLDLIEQVVLDFLTHRVGGDY
jgi:hypothetical protein